MAVAPRSEPTRQQQAPQPEGAAIRAPRSVDGERLVAVFSAIVEPIGRSLPASSEVVLHDLSLLPNSIVAIHGDVTGRRVGDPATDLLLQKAVSGDFEHLVGYETTLPDGRRMKSSTMVIRDIAGNPVAALCINTDLSAWYSVRRIADMMLGMAEATGSPQLPSGLGGPDATPGATPGATPDGTPGATPDGGTAGRAAPPAEDAPEPGRPTEAFVHDVDELAAHLIHQAVQKTGVPVELMHKRHKLEVVRDLKARGMFLLRDAVDMIASTLGVTRFTIYNYLNEIGDDEVGDEQDDT